MKELPKNWIEDYLYELTEPVKTGVKLYEGEKAYYSTGSIKEKGLSIEGIYSFDEKPSRANREVKVNDVLQARMSDTEKALIINEEIKESLFSTGFIQLRVYSGTIIPKYIFYYLKSDIFNIQKNELASGTTQVAINDLNAKKITLPIAPLSEQKRIVNKLDNLFEQLETIKSSMVNIPLLLKDFRQQVLSQAVTGKLTEEWRTGEKFESSEKLIQSIIDKRIIEFELKCKKAKEKGERKPNTPEYFNYSKKDIHSSYIENWFISPVGFLCDCIVPGRDKPKDFTGDIPWITTPDLTTDYITNENADLFLSDYEIEEVRAKKIPVNSVVVSIVGRFGIACVIKSECVINQQLHAFLPSELVLPEYLMYYFKTQESLMNKLSSSTTIAYINKTKANSILVNVPPLKEQEEIIFRVESLFAKADAIEKQYESLKAKIDSLPQALLHKAFKGELTEQLNSDGDAGELLKEIEMLCKAQHDKTSKGKKGGKVVKEYEVKDVVLGMVAEG